MIDTASTSVDGIVNEVNVLIDTADNDTQFLVETAVHYSDPQVLLETGVNLAAELAAPALIEADARMATIVRNSGGKLTKLLNDSANSALDLVTKQLDKAFAVGQNLFYQSMAALRDWTSNKARKFVSGVLDKLEKAGNKAAAQAASCIDTIARRSHSLIAATGQKVAYWKRKGVGQIHKLVEQATKFLKLKEPEEVPDSEKIEVPDSKMLAAPESFIQMKVEIFGETTKVITGAEDKVADAMRTIHEEIQKSIKNIKAWISQIRSEARKALVTGDDESGSKKNGFMTLHELLERKSRELEEKQREGEKQENGTNRNKVESEDKKDALSLDGEILWALPAPRNR